jgi:hypothetical protein
MRLALHINTLETVDFVSETLQGNSQKSDRINRVFPAKSKTREKFNANIIEMFATVRVTR